MKLLDEKKLSQYPHNYQYLTDIDTPDEGNTVNDIKNKNPRNVAVKDYMTPIHFLNNGYYKPIAKYFKEEEL